MPSVKTIWPHCYVHGVRTNLRGVAVLLANTFEYKVLKDFHDTDGNFIQLIIEVNSVKINLINIYAPNQDNPKFFETLRDTASKDDTDYVVICGDFNLVLDPKIDCQNYAHINNPKARSVLLDTMNQMKLIDAFRTVHPTLRRYSWRKRNPVKQSRLDYFLISGPMIDIISKCDILSGYRSDHSILELKIVFHRFERGRGVWKMNNSLLKDQSYLDIINKAIEYEKLKYALPVYNLTYLRNTDENIEFTIDPNLFLEVLYSRIRGESIKFATSVKKANCNKEKQLIEDINVLENGATQINQSLLQDKKSDLQDLRKVKINGQKRRARMQWLQQGEKATSYFCKLENRNYLDKTLKKITMTDGTVISEQSKVLKCIQQFYANLFKKNDKCIDTDINDLPGVDSLKQLPQVTLGEKITSMDLEYALKK